MSTQTIEKSVTKSKVATPELEVAASGKSDVVSAEIASQGEAFKAYQLASGKIGVLGLRRLAEEMALTANLKTGRPGYDEWHVYVMAVATPRVLADGSIGTRFDAKTQDEVLRHALKSFRGRLEKAGGLDQGEIAKIAAKFVKSANKGDSKGGFSTRMALASPATWEIALG